MGFSRWKFEFQPKISCKPIRISLAHKFLNQATDFVGLHRNRPCISARSTTLAPPVGLDPTTYRLTADRSTVELWRIIAYSSAIGVKFQLAPQVGLEPTTLRLTAECSAIELLRHVIVENQSQLSWSLNPATTYSPGPFPAKYHQRAEA